MIRRSPRCCLLSTDKGRRKLTRSVAVLPISTVMSGRLQLSLVKPLYGHTPARTPFYSRAILGGHPTVLPLVITGGGNFCREGTRPQNYDDHKDNGCV